MSMSQYVEETYDVYHENDVVARKEHKCSACSESIKRGHHYWRIGVVFDGSAYSFKRCLRCQTLHEHLRQLGTDEWPDEQLNCGHEYLEAWGRQPPEEIAALSFKTQEDMQMGLKR